MTLPDLSNRVVGHCPQCGGPLAESGPCPTPGCLTFPWRVHALGLEDEVERLREALDRIARAAEGVPDWRTMVDIARDALAPDEETR